MAFYTNARIKTPGGAAFASDENMIVAPAIPLTLYYEGKELARIKTADVAALSLRDFTESVATYFREPSESDPVLSLVEAFGGNQWTDTNGRHFVAMDAEQSVRYYDFIVIPGCSSRLGQNYNLFTGRFLKPNANPFLTTRTHLSPLVIKETELAPLYFLADCPKLTELFEVCPLAETGLEPVRWRLDAAGVYALDLTKLRRQLFEEHGVIASVFDIRRDGAQSCRIVIERAEPAAQRHRLKFRNSFGVFEIIELTGALTVEPQVNSEEFRHYLANRGQFERARRRADYGLQLSVSTGMKTLAEVAHLFDALTSDEVYLLDYTPDPLKVIPQSKGFTMDDRPEEPRALDLVLTASRDEISAMPHADAVMIRRFFSKFYNNKFQ